eukprot:1740028-Pleurochrysis_carterae.AAC.1
MQSGGIRLKIRVQASWRRCGLPADEHAPLVHQVEDPVCVHTLRVSSTREWVPGKISGYFGAHTGSQADACAIGCVPRWGRDHA